MSTLKPSSYDAKPPSKRTFYVKVVITQISDTVGDNARADLLQTKVLAPGILHTRIYESSTQLS